MRNLRLDGDQIRALASEVLSRGAPFRFQAHGWSMRPFVRDGDFLTVEPSGPKDLSVGDVALYVGHCERLTAHRVVRVEARDGRTEFLMRGDSQLDPVERVPAALVLGRCRRIERADKTIDLDQPVQRLAALLWRTLHPLGSVLLWLPEVAARGGLWLLARLQAFSAYRSLARAGLSRRIGYRVATVDDAAGLARLYGYHRRPELGDPVQAMADDLAGAGQASCTLVATVGNRIVGAANLQNSPDACGCPHDRWLFSLQVRARYRGAGIGEGLVRMALARASAEGALRLLLFVFDDNRAAIRLYQKLGFAPVSIPELDEQLAAEAQAGGRRRIILARPLR
jgi:ribosomal protein S18 acetylase RimI-like enzyme